MIKGKNFFLMIVAGLLIVISSCTNDQNKYDRIKMLDSNQNEIFSVLQTINGYKVDNKELDTYIRKDLKLPESHSLDNIDVTYNDEEKKGAIVIQYIDVRLRQVSIGFTFTKRDLEGAEVLGIDDGGKKYQCHSPSLEGCWKCCQISVSSKNSVLSCSCGIQHSNGHLCEIAIEDHCELTEIPSHAGQGN